MILEAAAMASPKTADLAKAAKNLGWKRVLIIDGDAVDSNFEMAARNIETIDVLPTIGANVYDILKRDQLVITRAGVAGLARRVWPKGSEMTAKPEHYDLIRKPIITEKATAASEQGAVVFHVAPDATKPAIKEAVEAVFGVKVKA